MARPIKNNADYFPHDADMRNDPRVKAIRRKFGIEGYGIYCMLIEYTTDRDFFEFEYDRLTIELIAGDFDVDPEKLTQVLEYIFELDLFQFDIVNSIVACKSLRNRLEVVLSKRKRDRSGIIDSDNTQSKVKESKVKKSKEEDDEDAHARKSPTPPPSSKIFEEKKIMAALTEKTADLLATEAEGSLSVERVENFRAAFAAEMQATGKVHESEVDLVRHFVAWVRKKRNFTGAGAPNPGPSRKNGINDVTLDAETYKRKQIF
jgi:hypothetical protein